MKIDYLKINGFGKLENKEIELSEGINIIHGKNESGKSTLCEFIPAMLYGVARTKNGKEISDFEKYKPWNEGEFSGKLRYTLENGSSFEVFRDFRKKSPIVYNQLGMDISKEFLVSKSKEIKFWEQQTGIDEKTFQNTALTAQQQIRVNRLDANEMIQKISNLVSTGDDNISFKKSLEKINKRQTEEVGNDRTKQRPINIVAEKIRKLSEEKYKLSSYEKNVKENEKDKEVFYQKLEQLKMKKEKVKEKRKQQSDTELKENDKKRDKYDYILIGLVLLFIVMLVFIKKVVIDLFFAILIGVVVWLRKKKSDSELENRKNLTEKMNEKYDIEQESIQNEMNEVNVKLKLLETEKENMDEKLEELMRVEESLKMEQAIREELLDLNVSFELAKECLENAYEEVRQNISPKFEQNLCAIVSDLTDGKYQNVLINDKETLQVEVENGAYMPISRLSIGTIDEMYLALRLSALEEIAEEKMPIILDEAFVYFDKDRLKNMVAYLQDKKYDNQIIIFTCSEREEEILREMKIEYCLVEI